MRRSPVAAGEWSASSGRGRRRAVVAGAAAVLLAGAGVTYASSEIFGHNQVGTEYPDGLQVSDNQLLKPLGERVVTNLGKFMGSTVSPDGHFLATTSTDKSVSLQIFDLQSYKLLWSVGTAASANQRYTNNTVGQEGPTYSPNGKVLWIGQQTGLTRFSGQQGRDARHADDGHDPHGERARRR